MTLEIVCGNCGTVIYSGLELKSPKDALRSSQGKCKSCGKTLSPHEYSFDIARSPLS